MLNWKRYVLLVSWVQGICCDVRLCIVRTWWRTIIFSFRLCSADIYYNTDTLLTRSVLDGNGTAIDDQTFLSLKQCRIMQHQFCTSGRKTAILNSCCTQFILDQLGEVDQLKIFRQLGTYILSPVQRKCNIDAIKVGQWKICRCWHCMSICATFR